jgi:hypothetical protein
MTTTSAPTGAPVRVDVRPSGLPGRPSRESANRMRDPAVAVPSALANALTAAPRLIPSSRPAPRYGYDLTATFSRDDNGNLDLTPVPPSDPGDAFWCFSKPWTKID